MINKRLTTDAESPFLWGAGGPPDILSSPHGHVVFIVVVFLLPSSALILRTATTPAPTLRWNMLPLARATIPLRTPSAVPLRLEVFDLTGRLVRRLAEGGCGRIGYVDLARREADLAIRVPPLNRVHLSPLFL